MLYETIEQQPALCTVDAAKATTVAAIGKDNWRAAAYFLECRYPDDWRMKRILDRLADGPNRHHDELYSSIRICASLLGIK